jgi:hypothetical protein
VPLERRRLLLVAVVLLVLVVITWACGAAGDGADGDQAATTAPAGGDDPEPEPGDAPPAFVPILGGTDEEGQALPPPVHAVFSVVVRAGNSWSPYTGPELTGLDLEAAETVAARLRRLDALLREAGIPASIELAYGPAAALCEVDPGLFDELEAGGHRIGLHARTLGEAFRAHEALEECGIRPTTASGLAAMADPAGEAGVSDASMIEAMGVLSVLDQHQVVGPMVGACTESGLAAPAHGYGTGAFTAPWRSAWVDANPCADVASGRIVLIDQAPFVPTDGADRIGPGALSVLGNRTGQTLAFAADLRFAQPEQLPHPGVISWGVSLRLNDLLPEQPEPAEGIDGLEGVDGVDGVEGEGPGDDESQEPGDDEGQELDGDGDGDGDGTEGDGTEGDGPEGLEVADDEIAPPGIDTRTSPLSEETLAELLLFIEERWRPAMEDGRLVWMLPDDLAVLLRPLPEPDGD